MNKNDERTERWLQLEVSDEEDMPDLMELKVFNGFLIYTAIYEENHENSSKWYRYQTTTCIVAL